MQFKVIIELEADHPEKLRELASKVIHQMVDVQRDPMTPRTYDVTGDGTRIKIVRAIWGSPTPPSMDIARGVAD